MKKSLVLILAGVILGASGVFAAAKFFSDVPENAWYSDAVMRLSEKGIITGYPDGTFAPEKNVNRAELAIILDRLLRYMEFSQLSIGQEEAKEKCDDLSGRPFMAFDEAYGQIEIFCSFGEEGECTRTELLQGTCFKQG